MKESIRKEILTNLRSRPELDQDEVTYFEILLEQENVTRDEGAVLHLSAYFVPYNSRLEQLLISKHLKSGLWLVPGGHVDPDELPHDTVVREWKEELGESITADDVRGPFYACVTPIAPNPKQPMCAGHYDMWYYVEAEADDFSIAEAELGEVRWITFEEAQQLITDGNSRKALRVLETLVRKNATE